VSDRLFLLDSTLLFFRALHGVPNLFHDAAGRSVNGVRGYVSYVLKLLNAHQVRFCAAAFDESLTTCWRNGIYPEYKANRPPAGEDVLYQLGLCRAVTKLIGIPVLSDLEYEADDFIATLARASRRHVVMVSRDKDLRQLLGATVALLDPATDELISEPAFVAEFGFSPALYPDFQALTGDSVDNVPGVKGVGPKSARTLVSRFGSLEDIYANAGAWEDVGIRPGGKMAERLLAERDRAFLYRRILRLDDRAKLPLEPGDTQLEPPRRDELFSGLDGLGLLDAMGSGVRASMETWSG
jgi:DNA polymerase-1